MPIVDIEIVGDADAAPAALAQALADEAGRIFGSPPGTTWVRVRALAAAAYAENGVAAGRPVFVTVTKRQPPSGAALAEEIGTLTRAVARAVGRPEEGVHVLYEPAAAGRVAFGGALVE
jgi:phenylpyruvate tautomerase PptA (4-oxalocrotonate tautomerase family)